MSRSLSPPSYDGLAFERLHAIVSASESEPVESQSPRKWFDSALRQAEAARQAERRCSKSGMYVAYTRLAIAYQKCRMHAGFREAKAADAQWAARVNEFKSTFELALRKAKELKGELKAAELGSSTNNTHSSDKHVAAPGSSSAAAAANTEVEHLGSIADRMKALRGHGMDVGSSTKRVSRDFGQRPGGATTGAASSAAAHGTAPAEHHPASPPAPPRLSLSSRPAAVSGPRPPSLATASKADAELAPLPSVAAHATGSSSSTRSANSRSSPIKSQSPSLPSRPSSVVATGSASPKLASPRPAKFELQKPPPPPQDDGAREHKRPGADVAPQSNGTDEAGAIDRFSAAFPSLDDLGKQFDDDGFAVPALPHNGATNGSRARAPLPEPPKQPPGEADTDAADFLSFPSLPSVPTDLPGKSGVPRKPLPPPPARPDDLELGGGPPSPPHLDSVAKAPSPPRPDLLQDPNRPASTLGFTEQTTKGIPLASSPDDDIARRFAALSGRSARSGSLSSTAAPDVSIPSPVALAPTLPPPAGPSPPTEPPEQPLTFPQPSSYVPKRADTSHPPAAPASGDPAGKPADKAVDMPKKPEFPFTNSIVPSTLREYLLNPAVDVLLLDVRPEEEFLHGFVGAEYHDRRAVNIVWLDPQVLMRSNLTTSEQLEDALSLSTDPQRFAFENRHRYDLVVVYDSRSSSFPVKGAPPTPVSRLWSIIAENEFVKPLPRFPTLLIGGYDGWLKFIKARGEMHKREFERQKAEQQKRVERERAMVSPRPSVTSPRTNGHGPPPLARLPSNTSISSARSRERYQAGAESGDKFSYGQPTSLSGHRYSGSMSSPGSYQPYQPHHAASPPSQPGLPLRASHGSSQSLSSFGSSSTLVQTPGSYSSTSTIAAPPRASLYTSAMTRRQSGGLMDNSQGYSGYSPAPRGSMDYPQAHALVQVPQPPPMAASHSLERQDQRIPRTISTRNAEQLAPNSGVRYWLNTKLGLTGLKNLGNTCYMNSTIQCLSATLPFARYFLTGGYKADINQYNPLGTKGDLANTFAKLLSALWGENWNVLSPISFRKSIVSFKSDFAGTDQHDSQEFLSFVMDGLHEDLNRIKVKPKPVEMTPDRELALETLPPQIASDREWAIYKQRNDSFIVDLFQGQYMNRMECLTCHKTSTVYDSFQWLTLDLPPGKAKVVLPELLDRWVKPEILDGDERWYCPKCKTHRRASKTLTLVRLPPVLLIQLKRFIPVNGGRFWDKSETPVIFPLRGLDLTRYVPPRQAEPGMDFGDPRTQVGPFKYDLYGVSNHMGTLSSGHYTAYVRSSEQWMYCEDSRVTPAKESEVVSRPAYILFYKRVPAQ